MNLMKIEIIILVLVISMSPVFVISYAQDNESSDRNIQKIKLYAQFEYRDSNGNLIAYFTEDDPIILELEDFNNFLDTAPEQIISKIGKFEIITRQNTIKFDTTSVSSQTTFGDLVEGKYIVYAVANHDGYPVIQGDTLSTIWTIIRSSG